MKKYRYFERTDLRRTMGLNSVDGRIFFGLSNFIESSPKFNVYYSENIEHQLDRAVEEVVNEKVETDMNMPGILLPSLFDTYIEELRNYAQKKFNQKNIQGWEWVKPLLSVKIQGSGDEVIIDNCYSSLQKLTKNKPEIMVKKEVWNLKLQLDVMINLPPDETDVAEEDEKPKRIRIKAKFDENGFPVVPWPDVKLDSLTKEELIEYIRICKRSLKQGAAMYAAIIEKSDKKDTGTNTNTNTNTVV